MNHEYVIWGAGGFSAGMAEIHRDGDYLVGGADYRVYAPLSSGDDLVGHFERQGAEHRRSEAKAKSAANFCFAARDYFASELAEAKADADAAERQADYKLGRDLACAYPTDPSIPQSDRWLAVAVAARMHFQNQESGR